MSRVLHLFIRVSGVFLACAGIGLTYVSWAFFSTQLQKNTIAAGIQIAGVSVGGKTSEQAAALIREKQQQFLHQDIAVTLQDHQWKLNPEDIDLQLNYHETVANAFSMGNTRSAMLRPLKDIDLYLTRPTVPLVYAYDAHKLDAFLASVNEQISADHEVAIAELNNRFRHLSLEPVHLIADQSQQNDQQKNNKVADKLSGILANKQIELHYADTSWKISQKTLLSWVDKRPVPIAAVQELYPVTAFALASTKLVSGSSTIDSLTSPENNSGSIVLALQDETSNQILSQRIQQIAAENKTGTIRDRVLDALGSNTPLLDHQILLPALTASKVQPFFDSLTKDINTPAKNARFHFVNGALQVFQPSEDGVAVDTEKTLALIATAIAHNASDITIATKIIPAQINEKNMNGLGIKELIGKGTSNYGNSPHNRIFNITLGASRFDGVVVAPGEELSAGKTIGVVDEAHGFLPELVILQDKTVPQAGGGLCQIGTTLFRAAMDAGLPITQRKNHSYAVSYYSPQGTDATIYYPSADLKFVNDTPNYILIQTFVQGRNVLFEMYGTNDGRTVEIDPPVTYDRHPDGSMKARWSRRVKKNGQVVLNDVFYSVYQSPNKFPHPGN